MILTHTRIKKESHMKSKITNSFDSFYHHEVNKYQMSCGISTTKLTFQRQCSSGINSTTQPETLPKYFHNHMFTTTVTINNVLEAATTQNKADTRQPNVHDQIPYPPTTRRTYHSPV